MRNCIYKTKNGWIIKTRVKVNDELKNCSISGFASKKEADERYEIEIQSWIAKHTTNKGHLVYDVAQDYFKVRSFTLVRTSLLKLKTQFNTHIFPRYKSLPLISFFEPHTIKVFYKNLMEEDCPLAKKIKVIRSVKDFYGYCVGLNLVLEETEKEINNILVLPRGEKGEKSTRRSIPQNEIKAFLSSFEEGDKYFYPFLVLARTGVRISELLGICMDCVSTQNASLSIKRQLMTDGNLTDTLKTNASYRVVPLDEETNNILIEYINKYKPTKRLFEVSHTSFKRHLREQEHKAGIPEYECHCFRHARCYQLAKVCKDMTDVVAVSKIMGHSATMFLDTYCSHLDEQKERDILSRL